MQRIYGRYHGGLSRRRRPVKGSIQYQGSGEGGVVRPRSLSKQLCAARLNRGLSVAEVANQVGVSTASIYFWESGRMRPWDANLAALCKVLKLPIRATRQIAGA